MVEQALELSALPREELERVAWHWRRTERASPCPADRFPWRDRPGTGRIQSHFPEAARLLCVAQQLAAAERPAAAQPTEHKPPPVGSAQDRRPRTTSSPMPASSPDKARSSRE